MKKFITLLIALISLQNQAFSRSTCQSSSGGDVLHSDDFFWNMTRDQLLKKYREVYESGKRLPKRAYYKDSKILLPINVPGQGMMEMEVPKEFILNITNHIQAALDRGYAEAIIFPDMGHSHFFMKKTFYEQEIRPLDSTDKILIYTKIFKHRDLKVLYHTAEQLKMKDEERRLLSDRQIQWRFYTRNVVGHNKGGDVVEVIHQATHSYNTARSYNEDYRYWGAGFSISASKDGCFPFIHKGKTYYFDLSLSDLTPSGTGIDF